jgi:hypothetical protein
VRITKVSVHVKSNERKAELRSGISLSAEVGQAEAAADVIAQLKTLANDELCRHRRELIERMAAEPAWPAQMKGE